MNYEVAMRAAIKRARFGATASGDVPVGAVVLNSKGEIIALANNTRELLRDPLGHAELVAIRAAARALGNWRLDGCTLVVTLEPCAMCAGAILQARIPRLVFGAWDEKAGAVGSTWDLIR
ncbi:MAG: nucleoside deaminase, partial [Actinobacteria bacterium]|nr:nucleoside deaminase [Actinomycetota bacterium]